MTLPDGQYKVDADASQVEWAGRNPHSRHIGTVDIVHGGIDIKDKTITGTVEIDMNTIHNIDLEGDELHPVLEAHLRSDDFFFTKMFPKAVYTVFDQFSKPNDRCSVKFIAAVLYIGGVRPLAKSRNA